MLTEEITFVSTRGSPFKFFHGKLEIFLGAGIPQLCSDTCDANDPDDLDRVVHTNAVKVSENLPWPVQLSKAWRINHAV